MSVSQADSPHAYPPFPDDVPTVPLLSLSLKKLRKGDSTEAQRLLQVCEDIGFFYLDLQDAGEDSGILQVVDRLFETAVELFDLPLDEKLQYDYSDRNSYFGYKAKGAVVVDRERNADRNESYNISRDEIMGFTQGLPIPDTLLRNRQALQTMMTMSHSISMLILRLLNDSLGFPLETLGDLHRFDVPSGDLIRIIKAPPQPKDNRGVTLPAHTDYGSVTVLFNRLGGLQVLPPGQTEWMYVRPMPGHAIINIGDALVKFTNGALRSNFHRIVSPPGAQAEFTRFSMLYFCRPNDDVVLRPLKGSDRIPEMDEQELSEMEQITSKEWILRRALGRRAKLPSVDWEKIAGTEPVRV